MPKTAKPTRPGRSRDFVVGRDYFARISAVEGISLTREMRTMLERFDREGLSPAERRRAIRERFAPAQ